MAELETAKKSRSAARSWLTRSVNKLDELVSKAGTDSLDIEVGLRDVENRVASLENAQAAVEVLLTVDELGPDIEEAGEIFDRVNNSTKAASRALRKLNAKSSDAESLSGSVTQSVKLPKLELPKFAGEVVQWQAFWDKFKATIDSSELPEVTKFTYLQSLLEGEARKAVEGLTLTSDHYKVACELLEERFGRREQIIFSHIQGLLNLKPSAKGSGGMQMRSIQDQILIHVRSLESLSIDGSTYGIFLTPLILSRLPVDVRMEWAREGAGKEGDLRYLLYFMKGEIERRERAETFQVSSDRDVQNVHVEEKKKSGLPKVATAAALQTTSQISCGFCLKNHPTWKCWAALKMSTQDRHLRVKEAGLCFRCLRSNHIARKCSAKCSRCQGGHHKLLCSDSAGQEEENVNNDSNKQAPQDNVSHVGVACSKKSGYEQIALQTAKVRVIGPRGSADVTLLLDSGSDRTYITSDLVKKLGLEWLSSTELSYSVFGGGKSSCSLRNVYGFDVWGNVNVPNISLSGVEVPTICSPLSRPKVPLQVLKSFGGVKLADTYQDTGKLTVDILIGLDYYWKLVKGNVIRIPGEGLAAQETVFGWILSGCIEGDGSSTSSVSHQLLCLNDLSEGTVS